MTPCSWNRDLAKQRGIFMGQEYRKKGVNMILGPVVGPLGRVALGGRNWEGFAADPYLSGILVAESVKGLQSQNVATSLKVSREKYPEVCLAETNFISTSLQTSKRPTAIRPPIRTATMLSLCQQTSMTKHFMSYTCGLFRMQFLLGPLASCALTTA